VLQIRATIVDSAGVVVQSSTATVTFAVTDGPAFLWGAGNGNPSDHNANHAAGKPVYHGIIRAVVRVMLDAAGTPAERATRAAVNVDAGAGADCSKILQVSKVPIIMRLK
jgi:beta-galactosidase